MTTAFILESLYDALTLLFQVIHGDLAARNVLVFPGFRLKITDFGLSKKLYNYSVHYVKKRSVKELLS